MAQSSLLCYSSRHRWLLSAACCYVMFCGLTFRMPGAAAQEPAVQRVSVEIFADPADPPQQTRVDAIRKQLSDRSGVALRVYDLNDDPSGKVAARLQSITKHFNINAAELPLVYGCNQVITGQVPDGEFGRRVTEMLRMDVYVRSGCSRCANAKVFLRELTGRYPGFEVRLRDIVSDLEARNELNRVVTRYHQSAASVPVFHFCNQLIIGFDDASTTGERLETVLRYWTIPPAAKRETAGESQSSLFSALAHSLPLPSGRRHRVTTAQPNVAIACITLLAVFPVSADEQDLPPPPAGDDLPPPPADAEDPELPLPPDEASASATVGETDVITLPLVGRMAMRDYGMPVFTIVVGLVDGFNPCAMWVLLLLLSILVNLHDRRRIIAVAGSFVVVSGIAYYAFMAAWLNVFLLIGLLRPVQLVLALIAVVIGSIHVKDFFAFRRGLSLSIPESAKPGIYQRIRRIVSAEHLSAAISGAVVLAVLVNIIELLCTAGLPALYTEILTVQNYPAWKNYAYLLLYIVAYMFDDSLMVTVVVITLGKRKLQESQGAWLKLISGLMILLLGIVMVFRPDWLM